MSAGATVSAGARPSSRVDLTPNRAKWFDRILFVALMAIYLFIVILPFYWIILSSLTPRNKIFTTPPRYWFSDFTLNNYRMLAENVPLLEYMLNSLVFATGASLLSVAAAFLASYPLARMEFRGATIIFGAFIVSIALPQIAVLAGLFEVIRALGIYNTPWALIFSYTIFTLPFTVWVLTTFMRDLPIEIEEAAIVDGARTWHVLAQIIFPLMRPALATLFIINFITSWNELLYPLVFAQTNKVMSVGLVELAVEPTSGGGRPWDLLSAMSVVMIVPVLVIVLLFQRMIVAGLTRGAMKG